MPTRSVLALPKSNDALNLPPWLRDLLDKVSSSPVAGLDLPPGAIDASTRVGGRRVEDWLGDTLRTAGQKGVPSRLRVTGMNPSEASLALSGKAGGQPMEVGMQQLNQLLDSGEVMREGATKVQPSIATLVKKLQAALGLSDAGQ